MVRAQEEALPHDLVRAREGLQVLTVGGVPRDVPREKDARLNPVALQELEQALPLGVEQREREPVELVVPCRQHEPRARAPEVLDVSADVAPADGLEVLQLPQLREAEGGAHLAGLHVVADAAVEELEVVVDAVHVVAEALGHVLCVVADAAPVAEHERAVSMARVVEHDHPAHAARRDDVRGVERDHGHVRLRGVGDRVAGVLEEPDAPRHLGAQLRPVHLAAGEVRDQEALGLGRDGREEAVDGGHVAVGLHVAEHGRQPELLDRRDRGGEGARGGHDLVALLQAQGRQAEEVPGAAGVHHEAVLLAEERGDLALELLGPRARGQPAVAEALLHRLDLLLAVGLEPVRRVPDLLRRLRGAGRGGHRGSRRALPLPGHDLSGQGPKAVHLSRGLRRGGSRNTVSPA
mmetsp:Transcript_29914/g.95413  ORF Transcript_29914/g.95413 Transcript_29914/m.95413 type:complete len:407 (-) Transcript_29914:7-1227(-)